MAVEVPREWTENKALHCSSLSVFSWSFVAKRAESATFHFSLALWSDSQGHTWNERGKKRKMVVYLPHRWGSCDQSHCTPALAKWLRVFVSQPQVFVDSKLAKEPGEASTSYIWIFSQISRPLEMIIWEHEASWAWKVVVTQSPALVPLSCTESSTLEA